MKPDCNHCLHVRRFLSQDGTLLFCHRVVPARIQNGMGRDVLVERDSIPEPQRPPGNKCGPEGIHFQQGEAIQ